MKTKRFLLVIMIVISFTTLLSSCFMDGLLWDDDYNYDGYYYDDDDDDDDDDYTSTTTVTYVDEYDSATIPVDNYEPDNSQTQAHELDTTAQQQHTISNEGDVDWFSFWLSKDTTYRINLTDISGFEPEMALYDKDGETLIEMKNTGTYTGTYDWWGYDMLRKYKSCEKESITFTPTNTTRYYLRVNDIYNAHSRGRYKISIQKKIDLKAITTLTATCISNSVGIHLRWSSVKDATGYHVYRGTTAENLLKISDVTNSFYIDNDIELNTTYYYSIKSYFGEVISEFSNVVNINYEILAPKEFVATPDDQNFRNNLSWKASSAVTGYKIYRTTTNIDDLNKYSLIATTNSLSYYDTNIEPNVDYYYYIAGYIGNKVGEYSTIDNAKFVWNDFKPTSSLINAGEGQSNKVVIELANKYNNTNISRYDVYRSTSNCKEPTGAPIYSFAGDCAIGSRYNDTDVTSSTYYYYCVRIIILINGVETSSQFSYYDSGIAK